MLYRIQEGSMPLDGVWQDRTVNLVVPLAAGMEKVNLVITRDRLPEGLSFDDHIAHQRLNLKDKLKGFTLLRDTAGVIDGRHAHLLEFTWANDFGPVYQAQISAVNGEAAALVFTITIPQSVDSFEMRQKMLGIVSSFKFSEGGDLAPETGA